MFIIKFDGSFYGGNSNLDDWVEIMIHIEELCTDPLFSRGSNQLCVSDNSALVYKIFRLITGQVKISCEPTERVYEINADILSAIYSAEVDDDFGKRIAKYIMNEDGVDSVEWFIGAINKDSLKYRNKKYFSELYEELCNYYFAIEKDNYVAAFVHEYRMLEYIAYAYPLIYAVRSCDFFMTFGHLKEFVNNQGKGELAFFKKAVAKIFHDSDLLQISFDISLAEISNEEIRGAYRKIFKKYINSEWLHDTSTDDVFAINFSDVGSVLIELRNKIFHHSVNTPNNLPASQIYDVNSFMKLVVPVFMNWLGVNYLEVFKSILSFEHRNS